MLLNAISADEPRLPPARRYAARLATALTSGGDARIRPDAEGRNQYHASVLPSDALAYGSSTISSVSEHAFQTLLDRWHHGLDRPVATSDYAEALEIMRFKLTQAFGTSDTAVVFAASGTDLEYAGLAAAQDGRPVTTILLGRDEVGSGCVHSAAGRFFADETATGARVVAQSAIDPVFAGTELVDVPVRDAAGRPRASSAVTDELAAAAQHAIANNRRPVVHVVHGSKSGLTLPALADVERLVAAFGDAVTIVVDACQLRVAPAAIRRYLALGCVVLMTGSKFAGGPPFSGFALIPEAVRARAMPLPEGYRRVATRAEWPANWPGADRLASSGNFGLLLRLQAAIIEIERFAALPAPQVDHIAQRFGHHVDRMVTRLELRDVPGASKDAALPCLAAATLRTLDLSGRWKTCDFDQARAIHRHIARQSRQWLGREIRLGQPVRTHSLADGRAAGTLRLSLSMPMMVEMATLDDAALDTRLDRDMGLIGAAISAAAAAMDSSRPPQHA